MKLTLERVEEELEGRADLPTLPEVATRLARMIHAPGVSAAEIGRLISEDPALTARVLRVVNSAYYGFPRQIDDVTHAIIILGFNKVRDIVLTTAVVNAFPAGRGRFEFAAFWRHSMATAIAAESIGRVLGAASREDAFSAGLLHDIGKLLLAACFADPYGKVLERAEKNGMLLRQAEMDMLGFDHAAVGKRLADRWGFSEKLREVIDRHHEPATAPQHRELASLVHVADIFARALLVGSGGDRGIPLLDPAVRIDFSLTRAVLSRAMEETVSGLKKGRAFFDLIASGGRP